MFLWSNFQAGLGIYSLAVHIMETLILPSRLTSEKITLDWQRTGPPLGRELFIKNT